MTNHLANQLFQNHDLYSERIDHRAESIHDDAVQQEIRKLGTIALNGEEECLALKKNRMGSQVL